MYQLLKNQEYNIGRNLSIVINAYMNKEQMPRKWAYWMNNFACLFCNKDERCNEIVSWKCSQWILLIPSIIVNPSIVISNRINVCNPLYIIV